MKANNEPSGNLTAFVFGRDAVKYDEVNGTITDNPYTPGTEAFRSWYRGYNYDVENPETMALIRSLAARSAQPEGGV